MAPISVGQTSFVGGEVSPSLYGRTKLAQYFKSVRTMRNFLIHPHGPTSNRPGMKFIAETKDSSKLSRLIPFTFSVTQTYMLEFGNQYMRVYKDGATVVEGDKVITDISQAAAAEVTSAGHAYLDGECITISGLVNMTELNGKTFVVANSGATFTLKDVDGNDIDSTGFTAYGIGGGGVANRIYEIATTYLEADLALLKYEQSADTLYINHPGYVERQVTRTGHINWSIDDTVFGAVLAAPGTFANGGAGVTNTYGVTAVTIEGNESILSAPAVGDPGDTFTWDIVVDADHYNIYQLNNGVYGWLGYAGSTRSFTVPDLLNPDMEAAPPTLGDYFGAADKYPGVSTFHEQRLVRARTNTDPQTFRGSVVGDFDNMNSSSPLREDDAYKFTLNANEVNEIRWMVSLKALVIGTSESIWQATPGFGDAITAYSIKVDRQNAIGVADVLPIPIGGSILFVTYSGERVYDLFYSFEDNGYKGNDLSVLASHLFKDDPIVDWCYQRHPDSTLWCVKEDGDLLGLTYFREHQVWGWHRHDTEGTFESTARISTSEGVDEVYFIVNRTIEGTTRRYVEKLEERLPNDDIKDAFFVDCGLSLDAPKTITAPVTAANPVVVTAVAHGFSTDDLVDIVEVGGMTEINDTRFKIVRLTADTFSLKTEAGVAVDGLLYTAYTSGGKVRKAITTLSGLDHLEGEDVAVLADGVVISGKTVAGGVITLTTAASRVHIGLAYISDLETLDFEFPTETGSTVQDKIRDVVSVILRLENSSALQAGPDVDNLEDIDFTVATLFDGDKEKILAAGEQREDRVFLRNTDPVPVTVNAIIARVEYGES